MGCDYIYEHYLFFTFKKGCDFTPKYKSNWMWCNTESKEVYFIDTDKPSGYYRDRSVSYFENDDDSDDDSSKEKHKGYIDELSSEEKEI